MVPVVELNDIAHVYVTDREASLAVEGIQLKVEPGSSSVWLGLAVAARQRFCLSLPACCDHPKEPLM